MTFLELCNMALEEADPSGLPLQDVVITPGMHERDKLMVRFIQRAYRRIQRRFSQVGFTHNSGVFITTSDGTQDYTVANVKTVVGDSLKARLQGTTAEWPVVWISHQDWRDGFNLHDSSEGNPRWLVELPNEQYRVEPTPDAVYEILAEWHTTQDELVRKDDVPVWSSDLHELIVWEALKDYATEFEVGDTLGARVALELPGLWRSFRRRYLPPIQLGGSFM